MYTKFIVVCDDDIDVRDWSEVIWALTTRVDPGRDSVVVRRTPIDYLDFGKPRVGARSNGHRCNPQMAGRKRRRAGPPDRHGGHAEAPRGLPVAGWALARPWCCSSLAEARTD